MANFMALVLTPGLMELSILEITMKIKELVLGPWCIRMEQSFQAFGKMEFTRNLGKST